MLFLALGVAGTIRGCRRRRRAIHLRVVVHAVDVFEEEARVSRVLDVHVVQLHSLQAMTRIFAMVRTWRTSGRK